jgi:hypothetical protein
MRANNDGASFQAKSVGDDSILVIVQPSKSIRAIGRPALCKVCNRINQLLTDLDKVADPRQMPLPLEEKTRFIDGYWEPEPKTSFFSTCICKTPAHAIGQKQCVRCNLPHRVPVG